MPEEKTRSPQVAIIGHSSGMDEARIQEVLALAQRLRDSSGGLDDDALAAVSEVTGAPMDFLRVALQTSESVKRRSPVQRIREAFLAFDPDVRRYAMATWMGTLAGFLWALGLVTGDRSQLFSSLGLIAMIGAVANCAVARTTKAGALSGAAFAAVTFISYNLVVFLTNLLPNISAWGSPAATLVPTLLAGLVGGGLVQAVIGRNRQRLGLKDPAKERQEMLAQLVALQERLQSNEQFVTFLSLDIVGSTRMKQSADPLNVEFTFTEYHRYVESVCARHGGRIHSTAGDGVTVVFDTPEQGFAAGRAVMGGLFEFNRFRNKIGQPIELRAGVHTGSVVVPGQAVTSVNFASVIDLAAHLQKATAPGTMAVSEATAAYLPGGLDAIGDETIEAADLRAAVWRPRAKVDLQTLEARN